MKNIIMWGVASTALRNAICLTLASCCMFVSSFFRNGLENVAVEEFSADPNDSTIERKLVAKNSALPEYTRL
jgi:hypothetical protein